MAILSVPDGESVYFSGEDVVLVAFPAAAKGVLTLRFRAAFSAALMGIGDISIYKLKKNVTDGTGDPPVDRASVRHERET